MLRPLALLAPALLSCASASVAPPEEPLGAAATVGAIAGGEMTAVGATKAALARIAARDGEVRSVLALSPTARAQAAALDARAEAAGPLHGLPVLIKDNIETKDQPTTAGSLALAANDTGRDAPAVARLRAAGAVILGKANLSEWANFRSTESISGWSAAGGQTRNPYSLNRTPCGSSSGSGAAVAAGFVPAALGTETNGSVICPAAANGVVGFKPTVGLVSRSRVVPISHTQDTIGPMARSVADAALLLSVMAGPDAADEATAQAGAHLPPASLPADGLAGRRVGVLRFAVGDDERIAALFDDALGVLRAQGAELVEIEAWEAPETLWADEFTVLTAEFKAGLNDYLSDAAPGVAVRSLEALIAFNEENAAREMPLFGQEILAQSQATDGLSDAAYLEALPRMLKAVREDGIERLLADVDLLVSPSGRPAFLIDPVAGDDYRGGVGIGWMAAMAGTPHLTVPMGQVSGLPVGLSFYGAAWADAEVLAAGADYEAARGPLPGPSFARDGFDRAATRDALARPVTTGD